MIWEEFFRHEKLIEMKNVLSVSMYFIAGFQ